MAKEIDHERRAKILDLREQGLTTHQIAERIGGTVQAILNTEARMGVFKRKPGTPQTPERAARNDEIYDALLKGANPQALAKRYGITSRSIHNIKARVSEKRRLERMK